MRPTIVAFALALVVAGCGYAEPSVNVAKDLNNNINCGGDTFVSGTLVYHASVGIAEDGGKFDSVIWPSSFTIRWRSGFVSGQYEVLNDAGRLVAVTGGHYRFAGTWFNGLVDGMFWACGVITPM